MIRDRPVRGIHAMGSIDDFVCPPSKGKVTQVEPVGWEKCSKVLKEINVRCLLIGNTKQWNHMQLHPCNVPMSPPPKTVTNPFTVKSGDVVSNYKTRKTFVSKGCTPAVGAILILEVQAKLLVRKEKNGSRAMTSSRTLTPNKPPFTPVFLRSLNITD